jgi:Nuclease-related domain
MSVVPVGKLLPVDRGVAGAGPQGEYQRRRTVREAQIEARWGRLASLVKLMSDEPQTTTSWRKGAEGERQLAAHLDRVLDDSAVTLHSRGVPQTLADIDHLVVAPSGVWVVDTKNYTGRVERRDLGSRRAPDPRLYVNGRDRTTLIRGLDRQVKAVRIALEPMDLSIAPVHPTLLFIASDWGLFGKAFEINGVRVLWAKRLCQGILEPGPWDQTVVEAVASQLSTALPPKT